MIDLTNVNYFTFPSSKMRNKNSYLLLEGKKRVNILQKNLPPWFVKSGNIFINVKRIKDIRSYAKSKRDVMHYKYRCCSYLVINFSRPKSIVRSWDSNLASHTTFYTYFDLLLDNNIEDILDAIKIYNPELDTLQSEYVLYLEDKLVTDLAKKKTLLKWYIYPPTEVDIAKAASRVLEFEKKDLKTSECLINVDL